MSEYSQGQKLRHQVDDDYDMLSEAGHTRRDALLLELQGVVISEGRRRRVRHGVVRGVSFAVLLIGISATLVTMWPTSHTPIAMTSRPMPESPLRIQIVDAHPAAVAAMIAHPTVNLANYYIDDRELVAALASIGRPSGLIRKGDAVCLANPMTDPILQPR